MGDAPTCLWRVEHDNATGRPAAATHAWQVLSIAQVPLRPREHPTQPESAHTPLCGVEDAVAVAVGDEPREGVGGGDCGATTEQSAPGAHVVQYPAESTARQVRYAPECARGLAAAMHREPVQLMLRITERSALACGTQPSSQE